MIHQFRDKKQIQRRKVIYKNAIGFGVAIILVVFGFLGYMSKVLVFIGNPIWGTEGFITNVFSNATNNLKTKRSLLEENERLLTENNRLMTSMIDYKIVKNENNELKEILNRVSVPKNYVLGNILTKPNNSPYDTVIIDIGTSDKIKLGSKVYAEGDVPVGVISEVYEKSSIVSLYSNPAEKTEGYIDGSNASVELIGRGGGNFEMIIPAELTVNKGTLIYLPGSTSEIIALVDDIISKPSDPFKKVILNSPINVQNLKWLLIRIN